MTNAIGNKIIIISSGSSNRTSPRKLISRKKCAALVLFLGITSNNPASTHAFAVSPPTTSVAVRSSCSSSSIITRGRSAQRQPFYFFLNQATTSDDDELLLLRTVRDELKERGYMEEWDACVTLLTEYPGGLGRSADSAIPREEAERLLAAAYEWRGYARVTSALARKYMKPKKPNPEQLQKALTWLSITNNNNNNNDDDDDESSFALNWSSGELLVAFHAAPTVYLIDPATAFNECLASAPAPYNTRKALLELIRSDPTALQNNYNCKDDGCNSECGTCWVSYGIKRGKTAANVDF